MGAANLNAFIKVQVVARLFYPTLLSNTYAPMSECQKCSTVCSCIDNYKTIDKTIIKTGELLFCSISNVMFFCKGHFL